MISDSAYRILKPIEKGTYFDGIGAKWLSWKLWGGNPETEHMSYTRKGWLQIGSQVGKLRKKGLVNYDKNCMTDDRRQIPEGEILMLIDWWLDKSCGENGNGMQFDSLIRDGKKVVLRFEDADDNPQQKE